MKYLKRKLILFLLIVICFLIQTTVLQAFSLASITPNLLVIVTSSIGFMRGKDEGIYVGFTCGLLLDIFYGNLLGFYAIFYMLIGYGNGCFQRLFYDDDIKLPLFLIGASDILYSLSVYVCLFLLRSKFNFGDYLSIVMLPELIYTLLTTLIFYPLIRKLNHKIDNNEKRSASKFV